MIKSWDEFYENKDILESKNFSTSTSNVYIYFCNFKGLSNRALTFTSSNKILNELSKFEECYTNLESKGGCIFIDNEDIYFVIINSILTKTHTKNGLFGIILYSCINATKNFNFVLFTTFSDSYDSANRSGYATARLLYGQIRILSTNSSNNRCCYQASLDFFAKDNNAKRSELKYSDKDMYMHYCNIVGNFATISQCVKFWSCNQTAEYTNFINNSQDGNEAGIVSNNYFATSKLNKCCFIKNNKYLFSVQSGSIEIFDCNFDNDFDFVGNLFQTNIETSYSGECLQYIFDPKDLYNNFYELFFKNIKKNTCNKILHIKGKILLINLNILYYN